MFSVYIICGANVRVTVIASAGTAILFGLSNASDIGFTTKYWPPQNVWPVNNNKQPMGIDAQLAAHDLYT